MLEIYIVRHGKTLFNEKNMVQGWSDSPLTKEGMRQASQVGKNMRSIPFSLAFSSPSERAMDTCQAIISKDVPMILDKRLKEMNFGYLEAEDNSQLWVGKPDRFDELVKVGWVEEGGENEKMVMERIASFFEMLASHYENEVILIASHGLWIDFALKYFEKEAYAFHAIENCSVSKVIYDEKGYHVVFIGDCSYRDKEEL